MAVKDIIVMQGQSVKDLSNQYYGSLEGWFRIAELNNIRMTEKLKPGQVLKVDDVTNETTKYLAAGNHIPATMDDEALTGIGYMEIGNDFIVS